MANAVYNKFKGGLLEGSYNLTTLPIYIALVGSAYTPDVDTHSYVSSLSEVVTPSNYVAYFALSSPLVTTSATNNQGVLDGSDILLANVTFGTDVYGCVLFGSSGLGAASDPLIAFCQFTQQAVTAGTFQITWNASGILAIT